MKLQFMFLLCVCVCLYYTSILLRKLLLNLNGKHTAHNKTVYYKFKTIIVSTFAIPFFYRINPDQHTHTQTHSKQTRPGLRFYDRFQYWAALESFISLSFDVFLCVCVCMSQSDDNKNVVVNVKMRKTFCCALIRLLQQQLSFDWRRIRKKDLRYFAIRKVPVLIILVVWVHFSKQSYKDFDNLGFRMLN